MESSQDRMCPGLGMVDNGGKARTSWLLAGFLYSNLVRASRANSLLNGPLLQPLTRPRLHPKITSATALKTGPTNYFTIQPQVATALQVWPAMPGTCWNLNRIFFVSSQTGLCVLDVFFLKKALDLSYGRCVIKTKP